MLMFRDIHDECGFMNIGFVGSKYTWCNRDWRDPWCGRDSTVLLQNLNVLINSLKLFFQKIIKKSVITTIGEGRLNLVFFKKIYKGEHKMLLSYKIFGFWQLFFLSYTKTKKKIYKVEHTKISWFNFSTNGTLVRPHLM